jgi:hypothetical protein
MIHPDFFRFFLIATLLASMPIVGHAGIYSWVDKRGQRHYGDQIPPKQIGKSHQLLDKQGRILRKVSAQKSRKQLVEERRQKAIQEKAEKIRQRQLTKDRTLLSTFSNVAQIDTLMNDRISLIDSVITRAQTRKQKIVTELKNAKHQQRQQASRSPSVTKQLQLNISEYNAQLSRYNQQIERNRQQRKEVINKFQLDKNRFIQLKAKIAEYKRAEALNEY